MLFSSLDPMFDHFLESSPRDDSNKWSNKGFGEEATLVNMFPIGRIRFKTTHKFDVNWQPGGIGNDTSFCCWGPHLHHTFPVLLF